MGFTPKMPTLPPPPPPPAVPATPVAQPYQQPVLDEDLRKQQRGQGSTILTSPLGLSNTVLTGQYDRQYKRLLGQ